ncbi:MAG: hypothetical protein F3745_06555, partial [Nitrospinae bacterium]|nr:hypothetical protein [Nitrospinota bacterium]
MNFIQELPKKKLSIPLVIILALYFLVASCSTKGPSSPIGSYPDRTGKYKSSKDHDFNYRQDRLRKQNTEKNQEQDSETFSDPATLADLKGFTDDLSRASLKKVITNQLQAMFEQEPSTPVRLGSFTLTRGRLIETLEAFLEILNQDLSIEEFNKKITDEFVLYRVGKGK